MAVLRMVLRRIVFAARVMISGLPVMVRGGLVVAGCLMMMRARSRIPTGLAAFAADLFVKVATVR